MRLTVGQYQQLHKIASNENDLNERSTQMVAVILNKTADEVDEMPYYEVNRLAKEANDEIAKHKVPVKPVSFLKCKGKLYQLNYKVATLTAGQNTEVQHWLKQGDIVANLDKILASIAVPIKKRLWWYLPTTPVLHEQKAEDMQDADFLEAYGCVVFFCKIFAASINSILPSLAKQIPKEERQKLLILQTDLMKIMDGFTTQNGLLT